MTVVAPATGIFENPTSVPVAPVDTNVNSIDARTETGIAIGGAGKTYATTNNFGDTSPQNLVLTGEGNFLQVGAGAANVAVLGGGQIIESTQFLGADVGKVISIDLGGVSAAAADQSNVFAAVDTDVIVQGGGYTVQEVVNPETGVVTEQVVYEKVSIKDAAGGMAPDPTNFYAHGGSGNDTMVGSFLNDFFRGGAGNDVIATYGGNDIIRGGSGSDSIALGDGFDTLFYTADQFQFGDVDTLAAFVQGEDKLVFDKDFDQTRIDFSNGDDISGYKTLTFTFGNDYVTLNVVDGAIRKDLDIDFLK